MDTGSDMGTLDGHGVGYRNTGVGLDAWTWEQEWGHRDVGMHTDTGTHTDTHTDTLVSPGATPVPPVPCVPHLEVLQHLSGEEQVQPHLLPAEQRIRECQREFPTPGRSRAENPGNDEDE